MKRVGFALAITASLVIVACSAVTIGAVAVMVLVGL